MPMPPSWIRYLWSDKPSEGNNSKLRTFTSPPPNRLLTASPGLLTTTQAYPLVCLRVSAFNCCICMGVVACSMSRYAKVSSVPSSGFCTSYLTILHDDGPEQNPTDVCSKIITIMMTIWHNVVLKKELLPMSTTFPHSLTTVSTLGRKHFPGGYYS